MTAATTDRVMEACWDLVTAWATDPGLALNAIPPLCEALKEWDESRFAEAFAAGLEASSGV
jgi:hypothetical protein